VYTFNGCPFRGSPFACVREGCQQDLDALGSLGVAERRVQARERRMTQDVDQETGSASAATFSA
jgi:hypothetical protein